MDHAFVDLQRKGARSVRAANTDCTPNQLGFAVDQPQHLVGMAPSVL